MTLFKAVPRDYRGNEEQVEYLPANLIDVLLELVAQMSDMPLETGRVISAITDWKTRS